MPQPTLHLMVGLPGSGKTTFAKRIAQETGAIRLTPDAWHLRLFGDDTDHPQHDSRHTAVESIMWDLAVDLLKAGNSVILDYGFWAVEERVYFYSQAKQLGTRFQVHVMDVPLDELLCRISLRNGNTAEPAFTILPVHMSKWAAAFQPVTPQELAGYADLLPED